MHDFGFDFEWVLWCYVQTGSCVYGGGVFVRKLVITSFSPFHADNESVSWKTA